MVGMGMMMVVMMKVVMMMVVMMIVTMIRKNFQAKTWVTGAQGSLQADYWFQPRQLESPGVGLEIVTNN